MKVWEKGGVGVEIFFCTTMVNNNHYTQNSLSFKFKTYDEKTLTKHIKEWFMDVSIIIKLLKNI